MKISIFTTLTATLFALVFMVSCDSPEQNVTDAKDQLYEAQAKLIESKIDSVKTAEWQTFKGSSLDKISANKSDIAALKAKKFENGATMDRAYETKINDLEARNETLQSRIDDFDKYNSSWETFKREFSKDMEDFSNSLKEISSNDTK